MSTLKKNLSILIIFACVSFSAGCGGGDEPNPNVSNELQDLPNDSGGTHTAKLLGSTSAQFGYYEYLPGGYSSNSNKYPVLIFLHGGGERGDGTNTPAVLDKILNQAIPKLIKNGDWHPTYPMIVISPQFHKIATTDKINNWGGGDPTYLKRFIEYVMATYRVNESRIYLTGLSHGGNGVYDYLTGSVNDTQSHIAAAAPVAAYGAPAGFSKSKNTAIWCFIGANDGGNTAPTINFATKYNAQTPAPKHKAKLTVFAGAGHDVWTRTYSGSGIGTADPTYDPFDKQLYDWMFEHKRED